MSPRPYRVAYLVSHPIQYQAPLLRHLSAQPDIELVVFFLSDHSLKSYSDPGFGRSVEWDVPLLEGYRHVFLPRSLNGRPPTRLRPACIGLRAHLKSGDFDALWVHGYSHQVHLRAIRVARELGIAVFLRGESLLDDARDSRYWTPLKTRVLRSLFHRLSGCLAIGSANREFYEHHGVAPDRIFPMPYAVDNAFFRQRAEHAQTGREALRRELGLDPGRPVLLYASKFLERKRPHDLLEAYAQLSENGREPEPYLIFVGDGPMRTQLERRIEQLGWSSVRILGFRNQTELPAYYDLCDTFVLPSSYEPWGLVINEVMNAGRPVIAADCVGAARDLIDHGVTGYTFPAGDTTALAARLRDAIADPEHTRRLGAQARRRVSSWGFQEDYEGLREALERTVG